MNNLVMPRLASVLIAAGIISGGMAAPSQAAETGNAINTQSRDAVVAAYKSRYLPSQAEDINWTGSVAGCNAGTQSPNSLASGTAAINFFRGLAGLDSIVLTAAQNDKAQAAALMMHAQGTLSHYPTSDWKCFTAQGQAGANTSNLHYSYPRIPSMATVLSGYMDDEGSGNADVGHRRWLLNPATTTMGIGTTSMFNAVNVIGGGTSTARANPDFIAFPNAGYFPAQLLPPGRWSLSSARGVDFSKAAVTVRNAAGTDLLATTYHAANGYGPNTVVFDVPQVQVPSGANETNYTVKVTGMVRDGKPLEHTYTVKLVDATVAGPSTPDPTPAPAVPTPPPAAPPATPTIKSQDSVLAIDSAGTLWNYGNLKAARTRIGTGWGIFSDIHVTDWNRDGYFDILGKTKAGQLHLYRALRGGGFAREAIGGGGWQNYTIDVGPWRVADKYPSIVAKHVATGRLYHYANTSGKAPSAGVQISAGWQKLDISLLDWNRDGATDIVARNAASQLLLYRTNGRGSFLAENRPVIGASWQGFTSLTVARGLGGAGTQGLLARTKAGTLVYYQANTSAWAAPRTLGTGWGAYLIGSH
ncbi:CAP domain-containing protein [Arthrobacter sp. SAFR-014]|uniref:CAP domain-containing protein n=1 Tax=unclassified Arthrobacter TaxID=235627 RepID=UPI003F7B456A